MSGAGLRQLGVEFDHQWQRTLKRGIAIVESEKKTSRGAFGRWVYNECIGLHCSVDVR